LKSFQNGRIPELVEVPDYPDHENIVRQFTKFTFNLHEKELNF
jgi:hypothetical protein